MPPLAVDVTIDQTTWGALAVVLTLLGAGWTWLSFRRRGVAAGLRALAWTLVPVAAWLTGTLKLAANLASDVLTWASRLVFSPTVWAGVAVAGVAVVLWFVSGLMLGRGIGVRRGTRKDRAVQAGSTSSARGVSTGSTSKARSTGKARSSGKATRSDDDVEGMDEIEAILKKHGI